MSTTLDHKAILRKNMVKLISDLRVDEHLLSIMLAARIISEGNAEDIRAETKRGNRNHEFVSIVGTRGENGLRTFIKGLISTEQDALADSLHKGLADMARKEAGVAAPGETVHAQETTGAGAGVSELEFEERKYHADFEATVTVIRKNNLRGEISVEYETMDGTATGGESLVQGVDYVSKSGTLTLKDGEGSQEITIIVDDDVTERKNFTIVLKNQSSGARLGKNTAASVIMTGEDILQPECKIVDEQTAKGQLNNDGAYPIEHSPKGLAVIINNEVFDSDTNLAYRDGAKFDCDNLHTLFENLGFKCDTKIGDNQTAGKMRQTFQELSKRDCTQYDALFVCVMSHGIGNNSIYGTDGRTIDAQKEIIQPFWSSKTLEKKPKVFLFQACRGVETSTVRESSSKGTQPSEPETLGGPQVVTSKSQGGLATDAIGEPMDTGENNDNKIVDAQNILRISSTVPGTVSFRENSSGSWFIRCFVKVTAKYAHRDDLRGIMYRVRELMGRKVANKHLPKEYRVGQCIEIVDTGFQKLYLLPGYPPKSK